MATILAIESSCDDTAAAVVDAPGFVRSSVVSSQLVHARYGGVVPEIASRAHQRMIVPVVQAALDNADAKLEDLDAVAVTYGPGLAGSLLVGLTFAKGLAVARSLPIIGVNHLEGHLLSVYADGVRPRLPALTLIVSGGHTELVKTESGLVHTVLGRTRDDAAGEAIDKFSKLMGLGFPGGPVVDKLAAAGNRDFYRFPRAELDGLDFSFSGIKTSALYYLKKIPVDERQAFFDDHVQDLSASFLEAIVDMLSTQLIKALDLGSYASVCLVGGVAANVRLRDRIANICGTRGLDFYIPKPEYRTDNAAMVGIAAAQRLLLKQTDSLELTIDPSARLA